MASKLSSMSSPSISRRCRRLTTSAKRPSATETSLLERFVLPAVLLSWSQARILCSVAAVVVLAVVLLAAGVVLAVVVLLLAAVVVLAVVVVALAVVLASDVVVVG